MSGDINTNFLKLVFGSNYSKLSKDGDFKEKSADFDFESIYENLKDESDDGTVKKKDLIKALQEEMEDLGLKTEEFDKTDESKYNTNENTNISKIIDVLAGLDGTKNDFSQEDFEYLENIKLDSKGTKITVKDSDGDTVETVTLKRNSKQTISSTSTKKNKKSSSSSSSSKKGSVKNANQSLLKLIYGDKYSKVKNEDEIKNFDINEIYEDLNSKGVVEEDELIDAIVDALYDSDEIDEQASVEEIVEFLSGLDDKDGFSKKDFNNLKKMSVSGSGKTSNTIKIGDDKYKVSRQKADKDDEGYVDDITKTSSSKKSSKSSSKEGPGYELENNPAKYGYVTPDGTGNAGTVQPSNNQNSQYTDNTPGTVQPSNQQKQMNTGYQSVNNVEGYGQDKIDSDKNKIVNYKNVIDSALNKIKNNQSGVSITQTQDGITGYTVDMGSGKYVHFECQNGVFTAANLYTPGNNTMQARVLYDSVSQTISQVMIDEVDADGKKGNDNFAETTGVFDASGNITGIGYDKNENGISEVFAKFSNNSLNDIQVFGSDYQGSYNANTSSKAAENPTSGDTFEKNGVKYEKVQENGQTKYYKTTTTTTKIEITAQEYEKMKSQ